MSETLDALAALTGHPVPQELIDCLAAYPAELRAFGERAGYADYELPLYPDLELLLAYNESVREEDIWTAEGPWPKDYLDLGIEIGGDHFALCVSETPARVYRLDHGAGEFAVVAPTLGDFVAALLRVARGEATSFPG